LGCYRVEWHTEFADTISFPCMRLTVDLTEIQKQHLDDLAARLHVAPETLAAAALRDLLAQREADFEAAATRVLEKNAELYRRLA
jgi:predicted transcriptional regulator